MKKLGQDMIEARRYFGEKWNKMPRKEKVSATNYLKSKGIIGEDVPEQEEDIYTLSSMQYGKGGIQSFENIKNMRTIKLSHEQIELLTQALGIAEGVYTDIYKDIIHKVIRSRGNNEGKEQERIAQYYHVKACNFVDLLQDIKNSKLDV